MPARYHILDTPTGGFAVCESDDGAITTRWVRGPDDPALAGAAPDRALEPRLVRRLERYFAGDDVDFADVPAPTDHADDFLALLGRLPRDPARRDTKLRRARRAGGRRPRRARAAGQAMRHNPLPIIIPCHRVRSADGGLGGFSGSDDPTDRRLAVKRWLLTVEGALGTLDPQLPLPWRIGL